MNVQHTLSQPWKMECGCPSGRGVENNHIRNLSPKKWMHCLHRKWNTEEEEESHPEIQSKVVLPKTQWLGPLEHNRTIRSLFFFLAKMCLGKKETRREYGSLLEFFSHCLMKQWWWGFFPHLRGFWENVQPFISRLRLFLSFFLSFILFFSKWILVRAHKVHSLG